MAPEKGLGRRVGVGVGWLKSMIYGLCLKVRVPDAKNKIGILVTNERRPKQLKAVKKCLLLMPFGAMLSGDVKRE